MSLTPLQVEIIVNTGAFDDAIRKAIDAVQRFDATMRGSRHGIFWHNWPDVRHRSRVQYRRKSRGHR